MIPMTSMSILACYYPEKCTGKMAAKYFVLLVLLAGIHRPKVNLCVICLYDILDIIPVVFVAVCVPLVDFSSAAPRTVLLYGVVFKKQYTMLYFLLYLTDMALVVVAACILRVKTGALNSSMPNNTARKNLRHLVLFAIPPYIVQIPYILRQISFFVVDTFPNHGRY